MGFAILHSWQIVGSRFSHIFIVEGAPWYFRKDSKKLVALSILSVKVHNAQGGCRRRFRVEVLKGYNSLFFTSHLAIECGKIS